MPFSNGTQAAQPRLQGFSFGGGKAPALDLLPYISQAGGPEIELTNQDSAGDKNITVLTLKQQDFESKRFQEAWSDDEITEGVDNVLKQTVRRKEPFF